MRLTFAQKLLQIPPPGGAAGCHPALLGAANAGVREGLDDDRIFWDIRCAIPPGSREVADREIWDTITTARSDGGKIPTNAHKSFGIMPAFHGAEFIGALAHESGDTTGNDLRTMSDFVIPADPTEQFHTFLRTQYLPTDKLYLGTDMAGDIRSIPDLLGMPPAGPKFIPNPLTGAPGMTKNKRKTSYRCDDAVAAFRFVLIEMDGVPLDVQCKVWTTIVRRQLLPVAAVTFSGGKSLHGLVRLASVVTHEDWEVVVKQDFFPRIAVPLGADGQCKNSSRLSRTPGALEAGRQTQWLLYLSAPQFGSLATCEAANRNSSGF